MTSSISGMSLRLLRLRGERLTLRSHRRLGRRGAELPGPVREAPGVRGPTEELLVLGGHEPLRVALGIRGRRRRPFRGEKGLTQTVPAQIALPVCRATGVDP